MAIGPIECCGGLRRDGAQVEHKHWSREYHLQAREVAQKAIMEDSVENEHEIFEDDEDGENDGQAEADVAVEADAHHKESAHARVTHERLEAIRGASLRCPAVRERVAAEPVETHREGHVEARRDSVQQERLFVHRCAHPIQRISIYCTVCPRICTFEGELNGECTRTSAVPVHETGTQLQL